MHDFQKEFLDFAIKVEAIRFGEFQLKSGRMSPYFFNAGLFNTGHKLMQLGDFYAQAVNASGIDFDMVYGPAYKGIPLAASLSIALWLRYQRDVPYCFNRKEAKTHAEKGIIVGAPLSGRVLIVDDVISAGISVREAIDIIKTHGATPVGVAIALDRQEVGAGERSAVMEVEEECGLRVVSIASLQILIDHLRNQGEAKTHLEAIEDYRRRYGVKS
jgi:orotate phosphoribosyltransferase